MNHIRQRNSLEKQLKSYKDFMPLCPNDALPKLMREMSKIHNRIETIKTYDLEKLLTEVPYQYETKQSKLNFSNHLE